MATGGDGHFVTDKTVDDNSDKRRVQASSHLQSTQSTSSSTHLHSPPGSSKQVTITTSDPGYKDTHPIGSRKVTENIITYHEPIFQTVVNTLYENKKSLNMGKRKVDEIEKEESLSPDIKKKRIDSPKIDTGFKVKKKCSIENIIERIRNEKTHSRGGTSPNEEHNEQTVSKDTTTLSAVPQPTESIQTETLHKGTELKKSLSKKACEVVGKKTVPYTDNDIVLDLSIKNSQQQKPVPTERCIAKLNMAGSSSFRHSLPFPSRLKHSENYAGKFQKGFTVVSEAHTSSKDKTEIGNDKRIKSDSVKAISASVTKTKTSGGMLSKDTEKLKHNKMTESITKASDKKSVDKSAIKTNTRKRTINKVTFSKKDRNKQESSDSDSDLTACKNKKSLKNKKGKKLDKSSKSKLDKLRKQKVPIAFRRVKREASLNAATLVNILYEKNITPKLNAKRSKSESDLATSPKKTLLSSQSFTNVAMQGVGYMLHQMADSEVFKIPKKEPVSPVKDQSSPKKQFKLSLQNMHDGKITGECSTNIKKEPESPKKRKESISDDDFNDIVKTVLKQKSEATKKCKERSNDKLHGAIPKKNMLGKFKEKTSMNNVEAKSVEKKDFSKTGNKDTTKPMHTVNTVVSKSPEEIAERKRKANLARLNKAKELLITKTLHNAKEVNNESESDSDSESDSAETGRRINESVTSDEAMSSKPRAKKGELCRAARTHVHVEAKTVFENTSVAPQWCECCQSTYYPSQPQQGTKVWRIKQLVDKGTQNPPELIQSASHHFIAAHASCEVRPYSSPTHVSVLDSGPYVAPLMSHGHVTCTPACGYRHTGMLHTAQCQNCALLPCQRYSNAYSVAYPHGHGSYPRSGCGSCCPGGTFHSPGQALIHQPNIPITTETPILVHHTVPLHDTSHTVPLQRPPHTEPGLPSCQVPLQMNDSNIEQIGHCCQLSQGEIIIRTNSQSDHEFIDVGRDDVAKLAPKYSVKASTARQTAGVLKDVVKPVTKVRKNSASNEIKASSQNKKKGEDVKRGTHGKQERHGKVQEQLKQKMNTEKEKQRKKSDSSKKKRKVSENKGSKSDKISIKGGKHVQAEEKEEEKAVFSAHGWTWEGEGVVKKVINIFDGLPVERKCFPSIRHEDGEIIHVKDCILVCSGRKDKDIPYVAKVTNFWEDPVTKEMMMTLLWYYRPEHVEGGRRPENQANEVFAAKHRDESLVACIDDRGFVLTYNEFCRFTGEVLRMKYNLPLRKKVVPDSEEAYPSSRIPPLDVDPENVFLCRHVYDLKLKRVLKNPS